MNPDHRAFSSSSLCKLLFMFGGILVICLTLAAASAQAQFYAPDYGPAQVGIGYQYSQHNVFGRKFHNNGVMTSFAYHLFDPLSDPGWRITASIEGGVAGGFSGRTGGRPPLQAKSLFFGAGPHIALESAGRLQPWLHLLIGAEHYRFSQTASGIGSNTAFAFMGGGGLDFRLGGPFFWRVQGDYLGTHFSGGLQPNFSAGSGLVFRF